MVTVLRTLKIYLRSFGYRRLAASAAGRSSLIDEINTIFCHNHLVNLALIDKRWNFGIPGTFDKNSVLWFRTQF